MSKVLCIATSLWLFLFWLVVQVLASDEIIIRALYPNPPGSDEAEWILLENTTDQTLPGNYILRDGAGKVVEYQHNDQLEPGYLEITRLLSGITLNNDSDWVELWQDDELVAISDTYKNLAEDKVFVKLDDGWSVIDFAEFQTRLDKNNWLVVSVEDEDEKTDKQTEDNSQSKKAPEPTNTPSSSVVPKYYPSNNGVDTSNPGVDNTIAKSDDNVLPTLNSGFDPNDADQQLLTDFSYQQSLVLPVLKPRLDVLEASQDGNDTNEVPAAASPPVYPIPDVAAEQAVFLNWQRRALLGSLSLFFSGVCWELISVPRLWHWYNDRQCKW